MKIIRRLIFIVIILAVAFFASSQFWPEWWKNDIVPPLPVFNDCGAVETEIARYDWDTKIATAIMKAESSCNAESKGDTDLTYHEDGRDYGYSVGVFQVRILPGREGCDSFNVGINVKCAYDVYKESGWEAWSMYTNGSYRRYLWRGLDQLF